MRRGQKFGGPLAGSGYCLDNQGRSERSAMLSLARALDRQLLNPWLSKRELFYVTLRLIYKWKTQGFLGKFPRILGESSPSRHISSRNFENDRSTPVTLSKVIPYVRWWKATGLLTGGGKPSPPR